MSGVYIENMEMPKETPVLFCVHPDGKVFADLEGGWRKYKAVPVSPHGDLIDAQEEMRLMQSCDYDTYDDYSRAFDMLDNAPTIIPADPAEEDE